MRASLVALLVLAACGNREPSRDDEPVTEAPDAGSASFDAGSESADAGAEPYDAGTIAPYDAGPPPTDCSGLPAQTPGSKDWTLVSDGVTRLFRVHVPPSYDPTKKTALVLNFHGLKSSASEQETFSRMSEAADHDGYVVVYPQGTNADDLATAPPFGTPSNERGWNAGKCCSTAQNKHVDDVAFVKRLLDDLESKLCIDPKRVYSAGYSNGAYLSYRLACELGDRIAAIAPVAGLDVTDTCTPARPMPILHFHGTLDYVVPYGGNVLISFEKPVADTIDRWATKNGCGATTTTVYQHGDVDCEQRGGCHPDVNATVTLCTIKNGGHTWPDGEVPALLGATTHDVDADAKMWEFFAAHPLP